VRELSLKNPNHPNVAILDLTHPTPKKVRLAASELPHDA
ncbi:unnamed protein product, partial [marine sediment metagenome]